MAKFWDRLIEVKFSFREEVQKIENLMRGKAINGSSLYDFMKYNFLSWQYRRNYINLDQLMKDTGIIKIINKCKLTDNKKENTTLAQIYIASQKPECSVEEFLDYSEFILNVLPIAFYEDINIASYTNYNLEKYNILVMNPETLDYNQIEFSVYVNVILKNIFNVFEDINYKVIKAEGVYRVIAKDPIILDAATKVSEEKPELSDDILLYGHRKNSGNLILKGGILSRMFTYYEGKLKKELNGYSSLISDIGFLANNVPDIRHSIKSKEAEYIAKLPDNEREALMDKLYTLFIGAIEMAEHSEITKVISEIKRVANGAPK